MASALNASTLQDLNPTLLSSEHLVDRHDNLAILKTDTGGRTKPEGRPACAQLFDRETHRPIVDLKDQSQSDFAEPTVHIFDPLPETLGSESTHISHQNGMEKVANGFALLLTVGMHSGGHAFVMSNRDARAAGLRHQPQTLHACLGPKLEATEHLKAVILSAVEGPPTDLGEVFLRGRGPATRCDIAMLKYWRQI